MKQFHNTKTKRSLLADYHKNLIVWLLSDSVMHFLVMFDLFIWHNTSYCLSSLGYYTFVTGSHCTWLWFKKWYCAARAYCRVTGKAFGWVICTAQHERKHEPLYEYGLRSMAQHTARQPQHLSSSHRTSPHPYCTTSYLTAPHPHLTTSNLTTPHPYRTSPHLIPTTLHFNPMHLQLISLLYYSLFSSCRRWKRF